MRAVSSGAVSALAHMSAEAAVLQESYRVRGWWTGERLLARYLRASASRLDALAVVDSAGRSLTHAQLQTAADEAAASLARCGARRGDVVLMALPNRIEWQAMLLGILRADMIPATIPIRTDAAGLRHVTELIGARVLIVPDGSSAHGLDEIAVAVAQRCSHALDVLIAPMLGALRRVPATGRSIPSNPGLRDLDHIAFTSSTTGPAKAVMHSADSLAALNAAFSLRFGLDADTPIFMASPLGHSVGAYHGGRLALFNAATLVLQDKWDPELALELGRRYRCAFTAAATPFLTDLVAASSTGQRSKFETMRWFLCGGAQVPPALMDKAAAEFPHTRVTGLWGMTEGGLTTCDAHSPTEKLSTTSGFGLPGLEMHTVDAGGRELAPGSEGELVMRGPGVFFGYLGQDELYRSQLTDRGFFRTGDLAVIDAEGYLRITGREKDLIIRGGVNISPVPLENILAMHPDIASVAVIGAPDARMGERLCAVIEPRGRCPNLDELQRFVRERGLPKHLSPEALRVIDVMPRTVAGKIRKADLRFLVDNAADPDRWPQDRNGSAGSP